jgi:hypothetical protein
MRKGHFIAAVAATLTLALPAVASADSYSFPLAGWWPMNDGSGQTVRDWSGHGNNGTLGATTAVESSDPTWIKGVFLGSALRFDGGDFVSIPSSPILEPKNITLSAWVRATGSPGNFKYVVSKGGLNCERASYGLYTGDNGGISFVIAGADAGTFFRSPQAPATVWDGQWHNAAGTFDGTTVRFFLDGVEVGNGTTGATAIDYSVPLKGGQIGSYVGPCTDALNLTGDVDGLQIWSTALPIADIWRALKSLFTLAR